MEKETGYITELNCFKWKEDEGNEREYFGIQVPPTKNIHEAIQSARKEVEDSDTFACGYYLDGTGYGEGEYHGLHESELKKDQILL